MAPGLFSILYFQIYKQKTPKISCCNLFTFVSAIFYIYLYQITSLQITLKGLTTPFQRWVQMFDCLCRYYDWGLDCFSYWIDTLVLNKLREILIYFAASPFPLQGKTNTSSRGSKKISGAVAREDTQQDQAYQVTITNSSLAFTLFAFASRFPLPHF